MLVFKIYQIYLKAVHIYMYNILIQINISMTPTNVDQIDQKLSYQ